MKFQVSSATSGAGSFSGKLQVAGCGGGLQAAVRRANGSTEEYFGLETEATSEFQVSPTPGGVPPPDNSW